jgi:hypothetical protein
VVGAEVGWVSPGSALLDVTGSDGYRRIGTALDVLLGTVAQTALQFIRVGTGHRGQLEGERMPEIVWAERSDPQVGLNDFSIVSAPDLLEHQVDGPRGESAIR